MEAPLPGQLAQGLLPTPGPSDPKSYSYEFWKVRHHASGQHPAKESNIDLSVW